MECSACSGDNVDNVLHACIGTGLHALTLTYCYRATVTVAVTRLASLSHTDPRLAETHGNR